MWRLTPYLASLLTRTWVERYGCSPQTRQLTLRRSGPPPPPPRKLDERQPQRRLLQRSKLSLRYTLHSAQRLPWRHRRKPRGRQVVRPQHRWTLQQQQWGPDASPREAPEEPERQAHNQHWRPAGPSLQRSVSTRPLRPQALPRPPSELLK